VWGSSLLAPKVPVLFVSGRVAIADELLARLVPANRPNATASDMLVAPVRRVSVVKFAIHLAFPTKAIGET
jgi:hypothetical protein